jgi:SNF2 family DNA or RNA helicase
LQLQEQKKVLVDEVIAADRASFKNLSKTDILELFSIGGSTRRKSKIK